MARASPGRWALTLTESSDPADIKFKIRREKVGYPGGSFYICRQEIYKSRRGLYKLRRDS